MEKKIINYYHNMIDFFSNQYYLNNKENLLLDELILLTNYHYNYSEFYKKIIDFSYRELKNTNFRVNAISDLPLLPVSAFKNYNLSSITEKDLFKTMFSSGTTSEKKSTIKLNKETAMLQSKALISIVSSYIGPKRLPLVLIDDISSIQSRLEFNARAAGLLGMTQFSNDTFYLLKNQKVDIQGLQEFLKKHNNEKILMFGFTFMVWEWLYKKFLSSNIKIDLSNTILFHSGGWKKLQNISVDNHTFKTSLKNYFGLLKIHNFYGMVEQVGSIYVECEEGLLHAPNFSDILIRKNNLSVAKTGQEGLLQTFSILPRSYPGHSLLTEDIGYVTTNECSCGKKGTAFTVIGRLKQVEPRGCSDVY